MKGSNVNLNVSWAVMAFLIGSIETEMISVVDHQGTIQPKFGSNKLVVSDKKISKKSLCMWTWKKHVFVISLHAREENI